MNYTKDLVDEKDIIQLQKIIDASVIIKVTENEKSSILNELKKYLTNCGMIKPAKFTLIMQNEYSKLLEIHQSTDWILKNSKNGVETSVKPIVEHPTLTGTKIVGKVSCQMTTILDAAQNLTFERMYPSIKKICLVEKYDENHIDFYAITHFPFPMTSRDWLSTKWTIYDPKMSVVLEYAIQRPEYPPLKKYIRGHYFSSGMVIVPDPENSDNVIITSYYQADARGKIPTKFLNNSYKEMTKTFLRMKRVLEGKEQPKLISFSPTLPKLNEEQEGNVPKKN